MIEKIVLRFVFGSCADAVDLGALVAVAVMQTLHSGEQQCTVL